MTTPISFFNPFLVWQNLAFKTAEMMFASAQVIAHRGTRIAAAGTHPSSRDRKEFALMGAEKVAASGEVARNIAFKLGSEGVHIAGIAARQMIQNSQAMMGIAMSLTPQQVLQRQMALVMRVVPNANAAGMAAANAVGRIAAHGLKPVHGRATRNAKRLAKYK